jgi:hypothetical protein
MKQALAAWGVCVALVAEVEGSDLCLENRHLSVCFDAGAGSISRLINKLTGETIPLGERGFRLEAVEFSVTPRTARLRALRRVSSEEVEAVHVSPRVVVKSSYTLGREHHFVEKRLTVDPRAPFGWKNVTVSVLDLGGAGLELVRYPHQKMVTWFGRSPKGGIFVGLEKPFDSSALDKGLLTLGYSASLKMKPGVEISTEAAYLGVYKRTSEDVPRPGLPLQSESDAMVAMTKALLGPPRHGFVPMACGWWSEMEHFTYRDESAVEADKRSIDFLKEVGIDWLSDSHPWGGETEMMNGLRETDGYQPGPLVSKLYEYAKAQGVKIVFWPTMNHTHPWWPEKGRPFLWHRKDWLMYPEKRTLHGEMLSGITFETRVQGNCIANRPFREWINRLSIDGMRTGYFSAWAMDGDFFGGGGVVKPVDCPRRDHDHLPGDSTWASERALAELTATVRRFDPKVYIFMGRPAMDLGVFYQRNVDAVFTIDEMAKPEALPGLTNQPVNVMLGDKIRRWSRIRVHHHFFPHYIDQPQVFVGPKSMGKAGQDWPSEAIDYVMLSAISSSPNQLYYLPTKAGIPTRDKQTIRRWLDWGRQNVRYLMVRKDLPDWPQAGKVDGSAHIIKDSGYVFLFNPNPGPLDGSFALDSSIGLTEGTRFRISSVHPEHPWSLVRTRGEKVVWRVPGQSAVLLKIVPNR